VIARTTDSAKEAALAGVVMAGAVAVEMCLPGGMQVQGIATTGNALALFAVAWLVANVCVDVAEEIWYRAYALRSLGRASPFGRAQSSSAHVAFADSAYARTLQWNSREISIRQIARQCLRSFTRPSAAPDLQRTPPTRIQGIADAERSAISFLYAGSAAQSRQRSSRRCVYIAPPQQIRVMCRPRIGEINAIRDDWHELMRSILDVTELLGGTLCSRPCVSI
jgi:hypothetical protein